MTKNNPKKNKNNKKVKRNLPAKKEIINHKKCYIKEIIKNYDISNTITKIIIYFMLICFLDYQNIIGKYYPLSIIIMICCFIIIFIINIGLIKIKKILTFFTSEINRIDLFLIELILFLMVMFVDIFIITSSKNVQKILISTIIIILILLVVVIIIRKIFYQKGNNTVKNQVQNFTLPLLYKNKIEKNNYVILDDEEIDREENDLIGFNNFITSISLYLERNAPKQKFTIGLIGKWGTGKSSIINLLQKKLEKNTNVKLIKFEPWLYENEKELFKGLYQKILKEVQDINKIEIHESFLKIERIIFGVINNKIGFNFFDTQLNKEDITENKEKINKELKIIDKKIVIVIDNLDRLEKQDILFIFKIIHQVFDFKNIIYVLCYDEERLFKMFEEELRIDKNYLEKIIQTKAYIPIISPEKISNILYNSIHNLMNINNIKIYNLSLLKKATKIMAMELNNIREIIIFINSISQEIEFLKEYNLDAIDFIIIQFIKQFHFETYEIIYRNKNAFVDNVITFANGEFKNKPYRLPYLENMLMDEQKNKIILNLIDILFPNLIELNINRLVIKLKIDHSENKINYKPLKIYKRNRKINNYCHNVDYFDKYFYINNQLNEEIDKKINLLKSKKHNDVLNKYLKEINEDYREYFFRALKIEVNNINDKNYILENIIKNIDEWEDMLKDITCLYEALCTYLSEISIKLLKEYYAKLIKNHRKHAINLFNYLEYIKKEGEENNALKKVHSYLEKSITLDMKEMCKKKIDIFEESDGYKLDFMTKFLESQTLKKYINDIINKNNIFKIAYFFLEKFVQSYLIMDGKVEKYFGDINELKEIVLSSPVTNSTQAIIKDIYNGKEYRNKINENEL